ncbi:MAG: hypothetical protein RIT43_821, partial [Bacteroidota bacterium]
MLTILLLIFTVIVMPVITFYFGTPLTALQAEILIQSVWIVAGVITYCFIVGELSR